MIIADVKSEVYRVPLTERWGSSTYSISYLELIFVKLTTLCGHEGIGWTFTVGNGASTIKTYLDQVIKHLIIGENVFQKEKIWRKMFFESHDLGPNGLVSHAISAADIAIWDLYGKGLNKPLYKLLGWSRDFLPGYGSGVNLHLNKEELLGQIERFLSSGYKAIKLKVGSDDIYEDLDRLRSVRELTGNKISIAIDANQKWSLIEAKRNIKILNEVNLAWVEEPLISDDRLSHAELLDAVTTPISVGESIYSKYQFCDWITGKACSIVQPDIYRVGGITEFLKIANFAEVKNITLIPHFGMELMAQVGCGVPNVTLFEGLSGASFTEMGILEEPINVVNGCVKPLNIPGHGVKFDFVKLKKFTSGTDSELISTRIS